MDGGEHHFPRCAGCGHFWLFHIHDGCTSTAAGAFDLSPRICTCGESRPI